MPLLNDGRRQAEEVALISVATDASNDTDMRNPCRGTCLEQITQALQNQCNLEPVDSLALVIWHALARVNRLQRHRWYSSFVAIWHLHHPLVFGHIIRY